MANSPETDTVVQAILNELSQGIQDELACEQKREEQERKFDISLKREMRRKKKRKRRRKKKPVEPDAPSQSVHTVSGGLPTLGKKR